MLHNVSYQHRLIGRWSLYTHNYQYSIQQYVEHNRSWMQYYQSLFLHSDIWFSTNDNKYHLEQPYNDEPYTPDRLYEPLKEIFVTSLPYWISTYQIQFVSYCEQKPQYEYTFLDGVLKYRQMVDANKYPLPWKTYNSSKSSVLLYH